MIFFSPPTGDETVWAAMDEGHLGFIDSPNQGQAPRAGVPWCGDNGCFTGSWKVDAWWRWLLRRLPHLDTCVFVTAPDAVGDAEKTYELGAYWLPKIRALGYPVAFVAQDGMKPDELPWDGFSVLFIGGTDAFKFSQHSLALISEAKRRGKRIHFGRINSHKRWRRAEAFGADSADGTMLIKGPAVNLLRVHKWNADLLNRPAMFQLAEEEVL